MAAKETESKAFGMVDDRGGKNCGAGSRHCKGRTGIWHGGTRAEPFFILTLTIRSPYFAAMTLEHIKIMRDRLLILGRFL